MNVKIWIITPFAHRSDGLKCLNKIPIRVRTAALPLAEGGRQEITRSAVGLSNNGREATIGKERVDGAANTDGIIIRTLVGEGSPLRGLVNRVSLENETALGADGVSGGVVEDDLSEPLTIWAKVIRHLGKSGDAFAFDVGCVVPTFPCFRLCLFCLCGWRELDLLYVGHGPVPAQCPTGKG